jgi:hypothetical protein
MAFDISTFASQLNMSAEDRTAAEALFGKYPTAGSAIETFLESQVATRLTPLQTAIEQKTRDLDAQFETLASIRTGDSAEFDRVQKEVERLSADRAALEARARKIASDAGLNPDEALRDLRTEPVVQPKNDPPAFDPRAIANEVNRGSLAALHNAALADDIADEHFALTGKRLSRVELLTKTQEMVKRTGNGNLGLREVWESEYGIGQIRADRNEAAIQQRISDAVAQREQALRDELALRPAVSDTPQFHSQTPIVAALTKDQKDTPVRVGGVPEGVQAAVAAYRKNMAGRAA